MCPKSPTRNLNLRSLDHSTMIVCGRVLRLSCSPSGCVLWRSLEMQWEKRTHVVSACMRLHNWCIDHNTGKDVVTESTGEDVTIGWNGERRRVTQHAGTR